MSTPLVDVLIPAYNSESTIRESVQSILGQTFKDIRVHVVNDGSKDGTKAILEDMSAADERLKVYTKENGGIVDALNYGLKYCSAAYLARHDGDDIAYPERFARQIEYLNANPDCVAVGCQVRHINAKGEPTGSTSDVVSPEMSNPYSFPAIEPYIIHPFLMTRREAVEKAGGYRFAHHCEDTDLYWRLQRIGRLHNLNDILGEYRLHAESISGSSLANGRLMAVFSQLTAISEQRFRNNKPDIAFNKELILAAKSKATFGEIIETCTMKASLTAEEGTYLKAAACAKILELVSYRPYDLELSDAQYVGSVLGGCKEYKNEVLVRQLTGTAANLVLKGRIKSGIALLSLKDMPPFLYRIVLRIMLPMTVRKKIRSLLGKTGPSK